MYVPYSTRVKLGVAVITLMILTSTLRQLKSTLSAFSALPKLDDISQYEKRFDKARDFLPQNQIVHYNDEFARFLGQCQAFVLAQYSSAPTVLHYLDSKCGHMNSASEVSSLSSRLILENYHTPGNEPYLLRLFPKTFFESLNSTDALSGNQIPRGDNAILLKDFGFGVRLCIREIK
jgi:hypothetical protein